jgi:hypothetical protein
VDAAYVYHLFGCAYGWTVEQVDNLTVGQVNSLLAQIQKYPPANFIMTEYFNAQGGREEKMDASLAKIPHTIQTVGDDSGKVLPFEIKTKTGRPIMKAIDKRTGKRII